jgi:hypothetical protein
MFRRIFVPMVLVLVAAPLVCGQGAAPSRPQPGAARGATAGKPAPSDAELQKAIEQRFARSKIAEDRYTVRVHNGIATIEGKTETVQRKGTATRLAKQAGARAVVNKIEVSQAARDKAAANLASGRRRAQVKRSEGRGAEAGARSEPRSGGANSAPGSDPDSSGPRRAQVIR